MGDEKIAKGEVLGTLGAIPADERNPVFNEPWEAQAFAIVIALHRKGVFTWDEWSNTLGEAIKDAQAKGDPDAGNTYYSHWLAAVERIVRKRCIADETTLNRYSEAWGKAAERTPHGEPIFLQPEDLR